MTMTLWSLDRKAAAANIPRRRDTQLAQHKMKRSSMVAKTALLLVACGTVLLLLRTAPSTQVTQSHHRRLQGARPKPEFEGDFIIHGTPPPGPPSPYNLPDWHKTWCLEPDVNPLEYTHCDHLAEFFAIPLSGGLTNALKMILLGAILAFEQHRCFYVEEQDAPLLKRTDPSNQFDSLIRRYFEPIGMPKDHPAVQRAIRENRVHRLDVREEIFNQWHPRRIRGSMTSLKGLRMWNLEGHHLKKIMMRRLWRPLPAVREATCGKLDQYYQLNDEYMAFSIRRGDKKSVENFDFASLDDYITEAEYGIREHFAHKPPKIFVATDDCSVMQELREKKPDWTFVGECDSQQEDQAGFALRDVSDWTLEQTDAHFQKFFVELYALAISKFYVGWSLTNVSWWSYFMRPDRHTFKLVDKKEHTMDEVDTW